MLKQVRGLIKGVSLLFDMLNKKITAKYKLVFELMVFYIVDDMLHNPVQFEFEYDWG